MIIRPGIVCSGSRGMVSDLLKDAMNGLVRVAAARIDGRLFTIATSPTCRPILREPEARGVFHANDEADERVNDIVEAIEGIFRTRARCATCQWPKRKLGPYAEALALDQRVRSPRARALGWAPALSGVSANIPRLLEEYRRGQR